MALCEELPHQIVIKHHRPLGPLRLRARILAHTAFGIGERCLCRWAKALGERRDVLPVPLVVSARTPVDKVNAMGSGLDACGNPTTLVMREASTCQMISQRRRPSSEQHAAQEWSTFH
jgi:hypothetical protein